jgi:uncharacterized protein (UPF0276 family)
MTLPLIIQNRFTEEYEGFKAARVQTSLEANNLELMLKIENISYRTKITKHKKRGREFLIMLVNDHVS